MPVETFIAEAKGVGRRDYTNAVARSTAAVGTTTLRQTSWAGYYTGVLPVVAPLSAYRVIFAMPQEDGSWDWPASTITIHFANLNLSVRKNVLVMTNFMRWASLADFIAGITAQIFPRVFGYGYVGINFTKGLSTQPGSVYGVSLGFWSDAATEEVTMNANGIAAELTPSWMP